jgi:hypothetical protein
MKWFRLHAVENHVGASLAEAQEEAEAFRAEAGQLRDALRMVRGDIALTLEEIDQYAKARQELEDATRERDDSV